MIEPKFLYRCKIKEHYKNTRAIIFSAIPEVQEKLKKFGFIKTTNNPYSFTLEIYDIVDFDDALAKIRAEYCDD